MSHVLGSGKVVGTRYTRSLLSGSSHSGRRAGDIKGLSTYLISVQVNAMKEKHKHSENVRQGSDLVWRDQERLVDKM